MQDIEYVCSKTKYYNLFRGHRSQKTHSLFFAYVLPKFILSAFLLLVPSFFVNITDLAPKFPICPHFLLLYTSCIFLIYFFYISPMLTVYFSYPWTWLIISLDLLHLMDICFKFPALAFLALPWIIVAMPSVTLDMVLS